jgi:hypothetical protein
MRGGAARSLPVRRETNMANHTLQRVTYDSGRTAIQETDEHGAFIALYTDDDKVEALDPLQVGPWTTARILGTYAPGDAEAYRRLVAAS